jgi:hypothetical protein
MASPARKVPRPGRTDKISVSLDRSDLAAVRRRARRLYGGNLSAVVAEGLLRIREEEGREALVRWLGEAGHATPEQQDAVRAEWLAGGSARPARATGSVGHGASTGRRKK